MGGKERERSGKGGILWRIKSPASAYPYRKYLSVLQAVYLLQPRLSASAAFICTASRLSAQPAFICSNRIRTVSLFRTTRVYLRRKRLPLAVFPANETPRV